MTDINTDLTEDLEGKDLEELREICKKLKIKFHPNASEKTLRIRLGNQSPSKVVGSMKHIAEKEAVPSHHNAREEVEKAVKKYTDRGNFETIFKGDNTVIFKCLGAEDSCNLDIPLRIIKMKAETVARGARKPRVFGRREGEYSKNTLTI